MKIKVKDYISNQILCLKEVGSTTKICIDIDKVCLLLEEWIEKNNEYSIEEIEAFFENVYQIILAEIEIRKLNPERKGIWLTK